MKVLRVIPSMDPLTGGPSEGLRNSIPELSKYYINNEVVCIDDPIASFTSRESFIIHALGPCQGPWCYSAKLYKWLLENILKFDVVIVHGLWLYHGYAVKKAFKHLEKTKRKLPKLLVMPHGMLDPYFQKDPKRRLKAIRNAIYWKLFESKLVNTADAVLFTCGEELLLAKKTFPGYSPKREVDIGYGIADPPALKGRMITSFYDKCPEIKNQSFILFLSRVHEKKGVDMLIAAFNRYYCENTFSQNPLKEPLPHLVIAGPGLSTSYGKMLKTLASNSEAKELIHFTGMLEGEAKWGALYGCKAFILASHQENFGIAVVEALACSKPVLISDKVNTWREIKEAEAGFVAPDSIEGTYSSLERWSNLNDRKKMEMGIKARGCYLNKFTIQSSAATLAATLKSL